MQGLAGLAQRLLRRISVVISLAHPTGEYPAAPAYREEFEPSRHIYASPRLAQVLGCPGPNRIARLMRLEANLSTAALMYRVAITDGPHYGPIAPNRVR